uniref:Uncharacterized protein n=1 Tax=Aegilops tauschii subsp. strangulata TaxID=200361 RepID=A0A453SS13_AEGTS
MFLPHRGPVDWQLIRRKAAQVVKDLVTRTPEFRHLLRLPPCPSHPCYTIPFGFGGCRRHKRKKNIGRMSASLLARRFLQKERYVYRVHRIDALVVS